MMQIKWHRLNTALMLISVALMIGCSSRPSSKASATPATPSSRAGAYYKDDGPPASAPADLDQIPDAQPRDEPLHRFANRPYSVFGIDYTPMTQRTSLNQRGVASWYGRKFHGQKTANGEVYDMFAMSAAHPTAPLPSFARVTSTRTKKSVVVRINDRGPFHPGRIIDLSYAAAQRIGIAQGGSGDVELELLLPPYEITAQRRSAAQATASQAMPTLSLSTDTAPLPPATAIGATQYFVQLGAFGNFANAQVFQQRMTAEIGSAPVVKHAGGMFKVQSGPFASQSEAQSFRDAAQLRLGAALPIITESSR
jgi:rare lipoprotein A